MDQFINNAARPMEAAQKAARVVEIIGPAGAGKTTLFKVLGQYPQQIRLSTFPSVRRTADAPFFIRYGLQLIPSLLRLYRRPSRSLTRREFAWMTILNGWPFVLRREAEQSDRVIILDQGPVFLLTEMKEFGPEFLIGSRAEELWQKLYSRWAASLDMIVWLDAADDHLLERIRTREQPHVVKQAGAGEVFEFLARYRCAYEDTLNRLDAYASAPTVLRYDTSQQPPAEIAARLLARLGGASESDQPRPGEKLPVTVPSTGAAPKVMQAFLPAPSTFHSGHWSGRSLSK